MEAMDQVFGDGDETSSMRVPSKPRKLQSWASKVSHATCGEQVKVDRDCPCKCIKQCRHVYIESYANEAECEEALLALRTERTEGQQRDESDWLFNHLYAGRCRNRGSYKVQFVLDGVRVCEQYFTVALGFNYPNRRIQKYVLMIQVYMYL